MAQHILKIPKNHEVTIFGSNSLSNFWQHFCVGRPAYLHVGTRSTQSLLVGVAAWLPVPLCRRSAVGLVGGAGAEGVGSPVSRSSS